MTEAEWLAATDPRQMVEYLDDKASDRKLRMFGVACCRCIWHFLRGDSWKRAIHTTERLADGLDSAENLMAALRSGMVAYMQQQDQLDQRVQNDRGLEAVRGLKAARFTASVLSMDRNIGDRAAWGAVCAHRKLTLLEANANFDAASLLRCIFGNPFRPAPSLEPTWLTWQGGTVPKLARASYDERRLPEGTLDPMHLAILADALEDAGCTDAELLGHLRGPGPHMRGCWALDLVLSKS
jgi:hypothetical protein